MPKLINIKGQRYGRLLVLRHAPNKKRFTQWVCRCNCGRTTIVGTNALRQGNTRSCGCLKLETISAINRIDNKKLEFSTRYKKLKNGCWRWIGGQLNSAGYGSFCGKGAHVQAFILFCGEVPRTLCVLHTCDNRWCVNPAHLFLGTHSDNSKDAWNKGCNFYQKFPEKRPRGEQHVEHKLTWKIVREMRRLYATGRYTQEIIAKKFGSTQAGVSQIIRNTAWRQETESAK